MLVRGISPPGNRLILPYSRLCSERWSELLIVYAVRCAERLAFPARLSRFPEAVPRSLRRSLRVGLGRSERQSLSAHRRAKPRKADYLLAEVSRSEGKHLASFTFKHRDGEADGVDLVVVLAAGKVADLVEKGLVPGAADENDLAFFGQRGPF